MSTKIKITTELLVKVAVAMNELMGLNPPIATEGVKDKELQADIKKEAAELQDGDKLEQDVIDALSTIVGKKLPKLEPVPPTDDDADADADPEPGAPKAGKKGKKDATPKTLPAEAMKGKATGKKDPKPAREPKSGLFSRSEWTRDRASRGKAAIAALVKAKNFKTFDAWSEATNNEYLKMGKEGRSGHCHYFCRVAADVLGWLGIAKIDGKGITYTGPKPTA